MSWVQNIPLLSASSRFGLSSWAADLNVSFNPLKSVNFRLGPHPSQEVLQVDGVAIPQRKEARHLGVCLTSDLRCWNSHVSNLILQSGCRPRGLSIFARSSGTSTASLHRSSGDSSQHSSAQSLSAVTQSGVDCPVRRQFALRSYSSKSPKPSSAATRT